MADLNTPLWRYMSLPRFQQMMKGDVWFASIASLRKLNDPLEGEGMVNAARVVEAMNQRGDAFYAFLKANYPENLPIAREAWLADDYGGNETADRFFDWAAKTRCAWCWYAADHESSAMWQNFGRKGVAVETTAKLLKRALPDGEEFLIGDVRYFDRRIAHDESTNLKHAESDPLVLRPYLMKGREFRDECEVRVVARCEFGESGKSVPITHPERLIRTVAVYPEGDGSLFEATRDTVVAILKSQFGTELRINANPDKSIAVSIGENSIRIEASSIQSAPYRQADRDAGFRRTLISAYRKNLAADRWPI